MNRKRTVSWGVWLAAFSLTGCGADECVGDHAPTEHLLAREPGRRCPPGGERAGVAGRAAGRAAPDGLAVASPRVGSAGRDPGRAPQQRPARRRPGRRSLAPARAGRGWPQRDRGAGRRDGPAVAEARVDARLARGPVRGRCRARRALRRAAGRSRAAARRAAVGARRATPVVTHLPHRGRLLRSCDAAIPLTRLAPAAPRSRPG
mgnify:FL=1|jgi:hypothetical protein